MTAHRAGVAARCAEQPPCFARDRATLAGMTRLATVLALAVLVFGMGRLFLRPPTDEVPADVDAVLVLGGGIADERILRGLEVLAATEDAALVLSVPFDEAYLDCRDEVLVDRARTVELVCLRPDPATTTGEANVLSRLAAERGWERVAVVTSTSHITRSRIIFERCQVEVAMAEARVPLTQPRLYWRAMTEIPSLVAALIFDRADCS